MAEALALHELSDPGALGRALAGNQEDIARIQGVVDQALRAWGAGRLSVQLGDLSSGWIEVFPELTEGERRLAALPEYDAAPTPARGVDPVMLRSVVKAIRRSEATEVKYQSLSTPEPRWRWITPHAIAFDGLPR